MDVILGQVLVLVEASKDKTLPPPWCMKLEVVVEEVVDSKQFILETQINIIEIIEAQPRSILSQIHIQA